MSILLADADEVTAALPMAGCIEAMRAAFVALHRGEVALPLRNIWAAPGAEGVIATMPAFRGGDRPVYSLKSICVFPANPASGLDPHQGNVSLYDGRNGTLLAILDAISITAIRTAAVSALATDLMARRDSTTLAVIGAGGQARSHVEALALVRPLTEVRISGRTPERARSLASDLDSRYDFTVEAVEDTEAAVEGADIVVTVTNSKDPVLSRDWLSPGTHVTAAGASTADGRELDSATVADSRFAVDLRESAERECGAFLTARDEGLVDDDHIVADLAQLVSGEVPGRREAAELTVFKSVGLAIEDLFAAWAVYDRCRTEGTGRWVDWATH